MCAVGREDGDGAPGSEGIDSSLVGVRIPLVILGVRIEGYVEIVVDLRDVLMQVISYKSVSCCWDGTCAWLPLRIAGNLFPDTPTMLSLPTLPRRRRSNSVKATTPTFLSEPDMPPPTKPVVYSPVPIWNGL